jgi:hypothetical protein
MERCRNYFDEWLRFICGRGQVRGGRGKIRSRMIDVIHRTARGRKMMTAGKATTSGARMSGRTMIAEPTTAEIVMREMPIARW